jgi:exo-1,4-beta-D-glucosaminidase
VSDQKENLNYRATTWLNTPTTSYADLSVLTKLAPGTVKVAVAPSDHGVAVTLENTGKGMALLLRATVRKGAGGAAVVPIRWDDNYVTLRPGAKRTLRAFFQPDALGAGEPSIEVEGFNVARVTAP